MPPCSSPNGRPVESRLPPLGPHERPDVVTGRCEAQVSPGAEARVDFDIAGGQSSPVGVPSKRRIGGDMMVEHLALKPIRLAFVTAALMIGAPAAHAFTMDTIANSNGGAKYVDPGDQLEDMAKGKTTVDPGTGGLHFGVNSSNSGSRNPVGLPPDQSRFNDR